MKAKNTNLRREPSHTENFVATDLAILFFVLFFTVLAQYAALKILFLID